MRNTLSLILLAVILTLSIGLISCGGEKVPETTTYSLAISSSEGGEVTNPGEATFIQDEGVVVNLVAEADGGYRFVNWTGDVDTIANVNAASTTITMNDDYSITANFEEEQAHQTVLIMINEGIYDRIQGNLGVFKSDLGNEGYHVEETVVDSAIEPPEIRNIIKSYYDNDNLIGAILVGEIRAPYVETHLGDFSNPNALEVHIALDAADMYYMDLDGDWEHVANPDFCEDAPPNVAECYTDPSCQTFRNEYLVYLDEEKEWDYSEIENKEQYKAEIWVSRIMAHNLDIPDALDQTGENIGAEIRRATSMNVSSLQVGSGGPPDLTVFEPEIDGLLVSINGVVLPGTPGTTITKIHWDWGDGNSEDHWFAASHTYHQRGEYEIAVTAYQSDGSHSTQTKQISLFPPKSEAQIINDFFQWDHEYRTGDYPISDKAYLCDAINDPIIDHDMDYTDIFPDVVKKAHISKDEYVTYLEDPEGSKLIYILAHSWPQGHALYDESLTAGGLLHLRKNSLFYILNACSSCRWDQYISFPDSPNYLGGLYVFSKTHSDGDYVLGAIGFTGVGGFNWLSYFTDYLDDNPNATYGAAYKYYFNNNLMQIFGPCNFVYLGDPTIGPYHGSHQQ